MACASKKKCGSSQLTDEHKAILATMAAKTEPLACKDIAAGCGMESKAVSCKLKSLKNKGYIDSPARCKYAITDEGKKAAA